MVGIWNHSLYDPTPPIAAGRTPPRLLCIGGEDHALRVPFLVALRKHGFCITAAGTGDQMPFRRADIAYHRYHFDRFDSRTAHRSEIRRLTELVREVQPDLIQTFDTKPGLLVPLAVKNEVPVIRTINGMGWVFSSTSLRALALRPIYCALQRLAARWTSATVFQNLEDKQFFERYRLLGGSPGCLIGGSGIDVAPLESNFAADAASTMRLRAELGLGNAPVVMTVSRLTKQKGIPTLLKAADMVHRVHPDVRFVLVGPSESEGPFAVDQAQIERRAPYVMAIGARMDVPALLKLADVFAFPSEYREGIPRVLLEAGAVGLPIVTTRMPGCSDVVTDGWNGWLVPPRDPLDLARRIIDLLGDRAAARAMGQRSIAFVRREFSLDTVLDQYETLYRRVLNESGSETALRMKLKSARRTHLATPSSISAKRHDA
jgi:glycosyltransferase involved in cell wall biosynthesis